MRGTTNLSSLLYFQQGVNVRKFNLPGLTNGKICNSRAIIRLIPLPLCIFCKQYASISSLQMLSENT